MPAWALLVFAPKWKLTSILVHSTLYPIIFGCLYVSFLSAAIFFGQVADGVGYSDIGSVAALFDHPNGVMTGWSHYLVFDLFVGAWIGREALRQKITHFVVVPCLIGTYVFGPLGLLAFLILRFALRSKLFLEETQS